MKRLSFFTLVLCAAGLTNLGHAADPAKFVIPDPVAVVEGKEIKAKDVQDVLASVIQHSGKKDADIPADQKMRVTRQIVDSLIAQQLIKTRSADVKVDEAEVNATFQQYAAQPGFEEKLKANDTTADKLKEQIRESARMQKWVQNQLGDKVQVSDADAKAFYDSHTSAFDVPETVRTSQIFIGVPEGATPAVVAEKQKAIDAAAKRVSKGEDFAKVASEVSEDTHSKAKGGDLDYLSKKLMPPEYADAAFALKKDEVSKVVKTQIGFHLIKATGHKDAHTVSFDEAKPELMSYLGKQKEKQLTMQLMQDIKAKADIKNNLPPDTDPAPAFGPAGTAPSSAPAASDSKPAAATPQADSKKN